MFNAFEYFETIAPDVPEIKKVYRISGLAGLEEVLSDVRNNPDCCLSVRDAGDGFLSLKTNRLDNAYHTLYIMVLAGKQTDHDARIAAKRMAMQVGIKLFDRAKQDSHEFGDATNSLDFSRLDYNEIGPVGTNYYYGYSFGFSINQYL